MVGALYPFIAIAVVCIVAVIFIALSRLLPLLGLSREEGDRLAIERVRRLSQEHLSREYALSSEECVVTDVKLHNDDMDLFIVEYRVGDKDIIKELVEVHDPLLPCSTISAMHIINATS